MADASCIEPAPIQGQALVVGMPRHAILQVLPIADQSMRLLERLRALIPKPEQMRQNRWIAWLSPWLGHARLWRWSRRGVALGVALGIFFGLLVPIAQIPLSVAAAVLLRANVPAAAAATLVTNPFTFGPIYYGAYRLGNWITGEKGQAPLPDAQDITEVSPAPKDASLWQRVSALGKPLLIGLAITAVLMGLLTYLLITGVWHALTWLKRRRRRLK